MEIVYKIIQPIAKLDDNGSNINCCRLVALIPFSDAFGIDIIIDSFESELIRSELKQDLMSNMILRNILDVNNRERFTIDLSDDKSVNNDSIGSDSG